jgi:tripartite-type tricarboxylate transporter receptor subunit TctC
MVTDLMGGTIDGIVNFVAPYFSQYEVGEFLPSVVISDARNTRLAKVPTLKESGVNFSAAPWTILQAPKGTPKAIVDEMSKAVNEAFKDPALAAKIASTNSTAKPSTPEHVDMLVKSEQDKWRPVIVKYNIKSE